MTTNHSQNELERSTKEVIDSVRFATSGVPKPEDTYLRNLKGDCLSRPFGTRELPVSGMVALLFDAFKKGKPLAELREVPAALDAALVSWFESKPVVIEPCVAGLYEEKAEAVAEITEAEARIDSSSPVLQRLRIANREHFHAREVYIKALEKQGAVA